ncbi:MAG: hypothetical protein ABEH64_11690 [Salinirussus sp.]
MDAVPPRGRGPILLVIAVCVLGMTAAPGVLAQTAGDSDEEGFGAQISAFMQSSAADADASVEQGMWNASLDRSASPAESVERRADRLQSALHRLENRTSALTKAHANGTLTGVEYTARASAIRAQIRNLRAAIEETDSTAKRHGVNETALAELREAAGSLDGPAVSRIARNISDAGPGPPGDRSTNEGADSTDRTPGPPTDVPGNASDPGPPDDPGNATGGEPGKSGDAGPPDGEPPGGADSGASGDSSGQDNGDGNGETEQSGNSNAGENGKTSDDGSANDGGTSGNAGDNANKGKSSNPSGGEDSESEAGGNPADGGSDNAGGEKGSEAAGDNPGNENAGSGGAGGGAA